VGAGVLLLYYKVMSTIFPACAGLPVLMASAQNVEALTRASSFAAWRSSFHVVLSPWLVGHLFLWGCACAWSDVRNHARAAVVRKDFQLLSEGQTTQSLAETFRTFDISGVDYSEHKLTQGA
jgi:hypothetical protein